MVFVPPTRWCVLAIACCLLLRSGSAVADRIVLKDGFELFGQVEVESNRIVVHSGPRVYYVGSRQLLKPEPVTDDFHDMFRLQQPVAERARPLLALSAIVRMDKFDEFGRRTVVVRDESNNEVPIIQAITQIHPHHVVVEAVERTWQSTIALDQIPTEILVTLIKRATDPKDSADRVRLISFLLHAQRYDSAKHEIDELQREFPEQSSRAEQLREDWRKGIVDRALKLVRHALDAGQSARARSLIGSLDQFEVPESRKSSVEAYKQELNNLDQRADVVRAMLSSDLAKITSMDDKDEAAAAVAEIWNNLSPSTMERLQPAVDLVNQANVAAEERLALAISGWVAGPTLAQTDWNDAIRLWRQRVLLQLALSAQAEVPLQQAVSAIKNSQFRMELMAQMVPLLPAPATDIPPGNATAIEVEREGAAPLLYTVWLPPEYQTVRKYPVVVTLHGLHTTPEEQIANWEPLARERGYILVAPEYRAEQARPYEYSLQEHRNVLDAIDHVRRAFAVDCDRIFLSGHELGGFAAWDIGMSHPDIFAGLIPFTGAPAFYCKHYWPNVSNLPVYAVEGGYNGGNPVQIQDEFLRYFANGYDAIYVEYPGRGREWFSAELPSVFDWMSRKRRNPVPFEFEAVSARHSDKRFYWLEIESFLRNATVAPQLFSRTKFRSAKMSAKVTDNNQVLVTTSGLDKVAVLLPYGLVHLDDPKLTIRVNRKIVHRGEFTPDVETMIRWLRRTGDRTNLVVQEFHVGRL